MHHFKQIERDIKPARYQRGDSAVSYLFQGPTGLRPRPQVKTSGSFEPRTRSMAVASAALSRVLFLVIHSYCRYNACNGNVAFAPISRIISLSLFVFIVVGLNLCERFKVEARDNTELLLRAICRLSTLRRRVFRMERLIG